MSLIFYRLFLLLFRAGIHLASLFNPKAKKWVAGRRNIFARLQTALRDHPRVIWMHCASLGEFEQGRPIIEALREKHPEFRILLTFFSPSGYEVRKDYAGADWVFYLPLDGATNARRFLEIVQPSLVIFVKYEFWFWYLKKISYRHIPLILVSALFWEKMSFFKWYGALQRKMLSRFDHLFVQDLNSKKLLEGIGAPPIQLTVSGDTRFDRVSMIAASATGIPVVESFVRKADRVIVAGSTWPADEALLRELLDTLGDSWKLIIAPHEISVKHLEHLRELFPEALSYTRLGDEVDPEANVLLIDNIGMLSRLYRYGTFSYIGGGFGKGIHNTLEAAVYGRPVLFGPVWHKFREAGEMISRGAAFSVTDMASALSVVNKMHDESAYRQACMGAGAYVEDNRGATNKILEYIEEKGWLNK